jgi:hypothetical protein
MIRLCSRLLICVGDVEMVMIQIHFPAIRLERADIYNPLNQSLSAWIHIPMQFLCSIKSTYHDGGKTTIVRHRLLTMN